MSANKLKRGAFSATRFSGRPLSGVSREVFRSPFASHIIIYEKTDSGVLTARIFHGNIEDTRRLL